MVVVVVVVDVMVVVVVVVVMAVVVQWTVHGGVLTGCWAGRDLLSYSVPGGRLGDSFTSLRGLQAVTSLQHSCNTFYPPR